jgi:hypothetical protein
LNPGGIEPEKRVEGAPRLRNPPHARHPPFSMAEGEEEIGSPHFPQIVHRPDILAVFGKYAGVYMPVPMQAPNVTITINLGAEGIVELELVSSGERWHRGPKQDLHSSTRPASIVPPGTWCRRWSAPTATWTRSAL